MIASSSGNVDVSSGASVPANTPNLPLSPGMVSIKFSISALSGFLFFKKFLNTVNVAVSRVTGAVTNPRSSTTSPFFFE
tara:strand:- start:1576 stop:1812 length:237 start_codon:yes stop_codon:yes gene_type:complete